MPIDSANGPTMGTVITLHLPGGKSIWSDSIDLSERITQLKESEFLVWSITIFFFGLVIAGFSHHLPDYDRRQMIRDNKNNNANLKHADDIH